jgi:hypothetical protein
MNTCEILSFPKITDNRGNLTFLQTPGEIPFVIKRLFWIYDVPGGEIRGGHAYKKQHEIIVALSGSFDITVYDKKGDKTTFSLNRSYFGLYLPPSNWREMSNFSTNAVSLHISNSEFNEDDYIRDFNLFINK